MTTAIIHGDPGSYKTSALISDYLVPAVKQGRVIVTNIRGVKPVDEIAQLYGFDLPDTAQIILVPFSEAGFEQMARFFHWVPEGALILMDEGQRVYPTRLRDFKEFDLLNPVDEKRPRTVEDSFDSHRHMNWDIYISTPNINKVHKEIRAVAEYGYRHKNMATVFSFLKGRYKRVAHNAENSGAAIGHAISATLRKIDKRAFNVYQSTATGQTKDSATAFSFFKQPKILLLFCVIGYSGWNFFSSITANGGLPVMFGGTSEKPAAAHGVANSLPVVQAPASFSAGAVSAGQFVENPFGGLKFYVVGEVSRYGLLFQVTYPDKSFLAISQFDLQQLGFTVARITKDMAKVTFGEDVIYALPKPTQVYIAERTEPVQPDINLLN